MFDGEYFRALPALLQKYREETGATTVSVRLHTQDATYDGYGLLDTTDSTVTFYYYDHEKALKQSSSSTSRLANRIAWPAVSVPFKEIVAIEIVPEDSSDHESLGFHA